MIEKEGVDCAYSDFQLVGLSDQVVKYELKSADELADAQWIPGPGVVMRRAVWEQVDGYSEELRWNEDWDFWIAAVHLGFSFGRVQRPLYYYRRHAETMTSPQSLITMAATAEIILRKRAEFFKIGDRVTRFRSTCLMSSARASRILTHRWRAISLTVRAATIDPKLVYREARAAARRRLRFLPRVARAARRAILSVGTHCPSVGRANGDRACRINASRDWDSLAISLHNQYGYLSHDYSLLGTIIDETGARSVIEVGCGSGRLVPVYLMHDVQFIWLQDVSGRALETCRRRFFCQRQIRYFCGNVQSLPSSATVDLIVVNRVFQHILDDAEFVQTLAYLAAMTRYFYINESGIEDAARLRDPYLKGRDYARIFHDLGWWVVNRGELTAEHGMQQSWILLGKEQKGHGAVSIAPPISRPVGVDTSFG